MIGGKLVIAIDFDGTIVEQKFPEIGALKRDAKIYINTLFKQGHHIIINTCRTNQHQKDVEKFLRDNEISYSYINENMPELIREYNEDCRKISADIYIDDKCLMGLPKTWGEIYRLIQNKL